MWLLIYVETWRVVFFYCLNVRNQVEGNQKTNAFLDPYQEAKDPRFTSLQSFFDYHKEWKASILSPSGNFSLIDHNKMFSSKQTYKGIQVTVSSVIEVTQFSSSQGIPFVLSERFILDGVEEYFGQHRSLGKQNNNSNVCKLSYDSNTLRIQSLVAPF